MSWETQAWAARQKVGSSSGKLLLLALSSCADAEHCAYPSVAWLAEFTDLNRKTIITTLATLADMGLIIDTGDRRGRTGQVKVYRMAVGQSVPKSEPLPAQTVPKSEPLKSPVFSGKESRKRDTEPFREPISQKATPSSRARAKPKKTGPLPDGWKPEPFTEGTKSGKIVASWDTDRLELEIEKFKAWHTARDNRWSSWQQAWATWVLQTVNTGGTRRAARYHERDNRDGFERALDRGGNLGPARMSEPRASTPRDDRQAAILPFRAAT